jgi:hypothetical protein
VPGAASNSEPGLPESLAVGNFACNDAPDLAIANFNGSSDSVAVLQGDGSGAFTSPVGSLFPANGNPRPLVVGDFNGDGKPDIAAVNSFQGTVTELDDSTSPEQCAPPHTPPPSIEALTLRRHMIRAGRSLSLSVRLSRSATIVVEFEKATIRRWHTHGQKLLRLVGTVTLNGHSGANHFTIKQVHGHRLASGRYTLIVFARIGAARSAERSITLNVRR